MISVILDDNLRYPAADECFSPAEKYPEYALGHLASKPNAAYHGVREVLRQAGLDAAAFGTPDWNPLGKWISKGQTVFILCNFVYHRRPRESMARFESKCTHASVIRPVIDYILKAVGPQGRVRFGNAPLWSCDWSRVLAETGAAEMEAFYRKAGAPVESADLRLFVHSRSILPSKWEMRPSENSVTIDFGRDSLLAVLDKDHPQYRVMDYNPERTDAFHANGSHRYVLNRHIVESDVIVSIPKLKTHEKVGITCALKGCVGAIGHKDCLAHHRKGNPGRGGDECRSDPFGLLGCLTELDEFVQKQPTGSLQKSSLQFAMRVLRRVVRPITPTLGGAWSGNDTCWRMSLDIARLIAHASKDGALMREIIRPHLAFYDGIVGGEGSGPLDSTPVHSGALAFASDPVHGDDCAARLMGLDPAAFAIVREAPHLSDFALREDQSACDHLTFNGKEIPLTRLQDFTRRPYLLPKGWR